MVRTRSSGNGIKTMVLNIKATAKALRRTSAILAQWFGYALGVLSRQDEKHDMIVLNGTHDAKKLQELVYEFIENFVLCPACGNPETKMLIRGNGLCLHDVSCGATSQVQPKGAYNVKMTEWLMGYVTREAKEKPSAQTSKGGKTDEFKDDIGGGEGVYINVEELTALLRQQEEAKVNEADVDKFFNEFQERCQGSEDDASLYRDFTRFADRINAMNSTARIKMVFCALFEKEPLNMLTTIEKRRGLLIRFAMEEAAQRDLLYIFGQFLCEEHPELMSSAPIIWYTLYKNEIVEDDALKAWKGKFSSRFEKKREKPKELREILSNFYTWLDKAETAPEEEEEHHEEEHHEEEHHEAAHNDEDEKEDIDIDAI